MVAVAMGDDGPVHRPLRINVKITSGAIEAGFGRIEPTFNRQRGHDKGPVAVRREQG
jgi:hypothetical protein